MRGVREWRDESARSTPTTPHPQIPMLTPASFLRVFGLETGASSRVTASSFYFAERMLVELEMSTYLPSHIAASALWLAIQVHSAPAAAETDPPWVRECHRCALKDCSPPPVNCELRPRPASLLPPQIRAFDDAVGIPQAALLPCATEMVVLLNNGGCAPFLCAVRKKYSRPVFHGVGALPPPTRTGLLEG